MNHLNMAEFDPGLLTGVVFCAGVIVLTCVAFVWWDNFTGGK